MTSFCVHVWNEAAALERLVRSSLPLADLISEWVILDHRSDDETPQVIESLRPLLDNHGIALVTAREERDLSPDFTFADVRNRALELCSSDVIVLHDADFILGPGFRGMLERAVLGVSRGDAYAAAFTVPVVWDRLVVDEAGTVKDHGRVWVHGRRPRIFRRGTVRYEQTKQGGRWERLIALDRRRPRVVPLTPLRVLKHGVVSVNVKPAERIALRETMTMYMQDAMQGRVKRPWLEAYQAGEVCQQPPYKYQDLDLRGWSLYSDALELTA